VSRRTGVALVDVLVAVGLCAVALTPVMNLFSTSSRRTACNQRRVAAQMLASAVVERCRLSTWDELTTGFANDEEGARTVAADPVLAPFLRWSTEAAPYRHMAVTARFAPLDGDRVGVLTVSVTGKDAPDLVTVTMLQRRDVRHAIHR